MRRCMILGIAGILARRFSPLATASRGWPCHAGSTNGVCVSTVGSSSRSLPGPDMGPGGLKAFLQDSVIHMYTGSKQRLRDTLDSRQGLWHCRAQRLGQGASRAGRC